MLLLIYFSGFFLSARGFRAACFHGEVVISLGGSGLFPTFARSSSHSELVWSSALVFFKAVFLWL